MLLAGLSGDSTTTAAKAIFPDVPVDAILQLVHMPYTGTAVQGLVPHPFQLPLSIKVACYSLYFVCLLTSPKHCRTHRVPGGVSGDGSSSVTVLVEPLDLLLCMHFVWLLKEVLWSVAILIALPKGTPVCLQAGSRHP